MYESGIADAAKKRAKLRVVCYLFFGEHIWQVIIKMTEKNR